jgi:uncharacterized membrane protein
MQYSNLDSGKDPDTIASSYVSSQSSKSSGTYEGSNKAGQVTLVAVFDSASGAEKAVSELRRQGFTQEEISIVSKKHSDDQGKRYEDDITDGALTGSTLGGIGGLLVGAGALAIPGIGPIVAAGPIAAALSGALAGGVAGGLIDWGIPAEASKRYETHVSAGSILAILKTQQSKANQASSLLTEYGANSVETHNSK